MRNPYKIIYLTLLRSSNHFRSNYVALMLRGVLGLRKKKKKEKVVIDVYNSSFQLYVTHH